MNIGKLAWIICIISNATFWTLFAIFNWQGRLSIVVIGWWILNIMLIIMFRGFWNPFGKGSQIAEETQ